MDLDGALVNKVKNYIQKHNLLKYREKVLVACSGGMDSVCLAEILCVLSRLFSWQITVGHVNHQIRGEEAQQDALWVSDFCRRRGLPFVLAKVDVPAFAEENGCSTEEAARILRYRALDGMAKEHDLSVVAVAHNQEDNAETILMNILRGSGIEGASGIKNRRGNVVRPLLFVSRKEIEAFCRQNNIDYRTDSSNSDKKYLRNKVRLELLPILGEYNPEVIPAICRFGGMLARDADFLAGLARECYRTEAVSVQDGEVSLASGKLKSMDPAIVSRVLLMAIKECLQEKPDAYINYKHIAKVQELLSESRTGAVLELPGGLKVKKDYAALQLSAANLQEKKAALSGEYFLPVPGRVVLPDKRIVRASIFRGEKPRAIDARKAAFPAAVADKGLVVRARAPGDVFLPPGMNGSKRKLKEFLIDSKIPLAERDNIPLVVDGAGILWIAGVRGAYREESGSVDKWIYLELIEKEYINGS
ncbi:MAG: tRNA lysidine(34) synthetase TilS [Acidaminococcales bacterium]|nr:tRNA lysidine(34) synthetase TilS [Acidaminococcales bacterium]